MKKNYSSNNLTLIIPTKDRPDKIRDLLDSIAAQSVQCRRIIIVDGGKSIEQIVLSYQSLPIEYYSCHPPGQIKQRNLAMTKLESEDKLVAFFDDDLVLMPNAVKYMIEMWNSVEKETAGISFNIVNNPPFNHNLLKYLTGMSHKNMGTILPTGYNVPISPTKKNIKTQWLCGGATVWKKSILEKHLNREVQSRWAICEDIIFSYPLSKKYPLYVCSEAKVRHEHVYDHNAKIDHRYYGRTATLWRLHFVELNKTLSKKLFFYMISVQILIRLCTGVALFKTSELNYALGQMTALTIAMKSFVKNKKIISVLEEDF